MTSRISAAQSTRAPLALHFGPKVIAERGKQFQGNAHLGVGVAARREWRAGRYLAAANAARRASRRAGPCKSA